MSAREKLSMQFGMPTNNEELGDFVAGLSDSEYKEVMNGVAGMQRGHPENVMLAATERLGPNIYTNSLEHIGDLSHRINETNGPFVGIKVETQLRNLTRPYGYEKEMLEQINDNNKYWESTGRDPVTIDDYRSAGREYADAHRDIPPINEPTARARHAAISLGHMRFPYTIKNLRSLDGMMSDADHFKQQLTRGSALEFLRRRYGR